MTDPTRLLDEGATDIELAILRAGAGEEPPEQGRSRLSALLGLSAGLSASVTAAGSKAAAGSSLKALAAQLGVKWLVALSVAGAVAGGSAIAYRHRSSPAVRPHRDAIEANRGDLPVVNATAEPAPPRAEAPPVPAPEDRPALSSKVPQAGQHESSARSGAKSIGVEIEQLDGVRRALRASSPAEAIRLLDGYDREHGGGVLAQEAALLRIEALAASGNLAAARALAERFLQDNPKTPHRRRISALVGDIR